MRTPNGEYVQYHSSADNLDLITPAALGDSWRLTSLAIDILQENRCYLNLSPKGEPRLGARGLFADAGRLGMLWTLNLSDGGHTLLDNRRALRHAVLEPARGCAPSRRKWIAGGGQ